MTEIQKIVYIDADVLVLQNIDDLFSRPGRICPAAAPDTFPPDKFNAGVMVVEPCKEIFDDMMTYGYLLPNWVPLLTRYMCRKAGTTQNDPMKTMEEYKPFDKECFGRKGGHKHSLD